MKANDFVDSIGGRIVVLLAAAILIECFDFEMS
jgi:hypothetical protein